VHLNDDEVVAGDRKFLDGKKKNTCQSPVDRQET
jgi:hypothetical protein